MLDSDPDSRIDLFGVCEFTQRYVEKQKLRRLEVYRNLAKPVIEGVGVMGTLLAAFDYIKEPASPVSMDLKLYGRLCHKLASRG